MITQRFAFFAMTLGWSLILNRLTGISSPLIIVVPILVAVSGWKYTGYFIIINVLVALPQNIPIGTFIFQYYQMLLNLKSFVSSVANTVNPVNNMMSNNLISNNLTSSNLMNNNALTPQFGTLIYFMHLMNNPFIGFGISIGLVLFISLCIRLLIRVIREYIKLHRMVKCAIRNRRGVSRY